MGLISFMSFLFIYLLVLECSELGTSVYAPCLRPFSVILVKKIVNSIR